MNDESQSTNDESKSKTRQSMKCKLEGANFFFFILTMYTGFYTNKVQESSHKSESVRGRQADKTLRLVGFDSAEEQLMPNRSRAQIGVDNTQLS